ncbi:MAG: hypothetical protein QM714_12550 [Nocardioides sp.]|uniref:hypothetical protein n=1 Tax=Nocardioides sp. TaxID=35761 RepID=UPI0039E5C5A9
MTNEAPARYMQGIAVPESSVNPREFFLRTRRRTQLESSKAYAGLGQTDTFELKKTDILAGLFIRFDGSLVTVKGTGQVNTQARWPYDLIKQLKFTANGQSNIINCSGLKLKAREAMGKGDLTDRGVSQNYNGATVTQGTLSQACESWGVGSRATNVPDGTYDIDLSWFVPVAEDQIDLSGAIFAASSSTDLTVNIDWAPPTDVFTLSGTATATLTGTVQVVALRYSIPLGPDGQIVVPDLSVFHSLIQTRYTNLANGENELRLIGQGAGKTVLRAFSQLWNGAPAVPVVVNEDNFGKMAWRFGGNETPDEYPDAQVLRYINERMYCSDIGAVWGFHCHEFASENAFRDAVDLGTASEWRQVINVLPAVVLSNAAVETTVESIFTAGAGS